MMQGEEAQTSAWFAEAALWNVRTIWQKLFDAVSGQPDMEYAMADATIVKVHRHGQGAGLKARP